MDELGDSWMLNLSFPSILYFILLLNMFLSAYNLMTFCSSDPFTFQKSIGFYLLVCISKRQPLTFFSWLPNLYLLYTYASQLLFVKGALQSRLFWEHFYGAGLLLSSYWHNDFLPSDLNKEIKCLRKSYITRG